VNNNKNLFTTLNYEIWQEKFFRARIALTYKLSIVFFSISSIFCWLLIYLDSSENIWSLKVNFSILLLCTFGLFATRKLQRKTQLNLIFIAWSWLLMFAFNIETEAPVEGIALYPELSTDVLLIQAILIPVKLSLHLISQISTISAYFIVRYFTSTHEGNTYLSDAVVLASELLDIFGFCLAGNLTIFLHEKLRKSELKTRRELQLFVRDISQKLRQPLLSNLEKLKQILKHSGDLIVITRADLTIILHRSDRQLTLIQLILERAKINKLKQANHTPTDYQLWRSQFIKQRISWFLGICLGYCVPLLGICAYIVIFETESSEQRAFLVYSLTLVVIIAFLAIFYRLSQTQLFESYFAGFFIVMILLICLATQTGEILSGYSKPAVTTWSTVFLLCATLFPIYWRLHLTAQISVAVGYLLLITAFTIKVPMSTIDILDTILSLFSICLICNITVYTFERLQKAEYESRQQIQLFLYAVAHDLKTPVLGFLMFLENLLSQPQATFNLAYSQVNKMIQASDRQLDLLDSLLEVHQSESTGIICHCQLIQLNNLITALVEQLEPILAKNEASITNLIPNNLPNINADSTQLGRVYENLIINAIKHNPPGIQIILKATINKDMVHCSVEDNGVGIEPTRSERIFSLYSSDRLQRTPGLGLGLYLCQQIILAHQGRIGVNSFPGMGATFWFSLPIAENK
jgi:signal transduction histidine kinase